MSLNILMKEHFEPEHSLAESSLGLLRFARTCSFNHMLNMLSVASTHKTQHPGAILYRDVLMPRRQESRAAISATGTTYGLGD